MTLLHCKVGDPNSARTINADQVPPNIILTLITPITSAVEGKLGLLRPGIDQRRAIISVGGDCEP